jgi:formylglycine-generating enzyme required for sulfatase activity
MLLTLVSGTALSQSGGGQLARPSFASAWPTIAYNPRPAQDDLILPLPCGGAMAFRRIETPSGDGILEDRPILIGSAARETGHAEYQRRAFVSGPFGPAGGRHFYMAKYEVTRAQYDALTGACPSVLAGAAARLPVVDVSWHEAVHAAARFSTFLIRDHAGLLPRRGEQPGFVRLPTEAEWEFAARGGAIVSEPEFQARAFPTPLGGLEAYAWFQGPGGAAGRLSPIGGKLPNPLGLHDMLGNAAEWVLDSFRLQRVGRAHGLTGGLIHRGGHFLSSGREIRSSLRVEIAPFTASNGAPARLDTVGFRFVLGAAAQGSLPEIAAAAAAFDAELGSLTIRPEDPLTILTALREASEPTLHPAIDRLRSAYEGELRQRLDNARLIARAQLQAAAVLAYSVIVAEQRILALRDGARRDASIQRWLDRAVPPLERERDTSLAAYGAVLAELATIRDFDVVAEASLAAQELRGRGQPDLAGRVTMTAEFVAAARQGTAPTLRSLLDRPELR